MSERVFVPIALLVICGCLCILVTLSGEWAYAEGRDAGIYAEDPETCPYVDWRRDDWRAGWATGRALVQANADPEACKPEEGQE